MVKHFFKLCAIHARMDLASLLRDSRYMLVAILADIISNLSSIAGIFLLAMKLGSLGGLSQYEILFMLAYSNMINGLLLIIGGCNNALNISRIIGRGQWEHMFIMPVPYVLQLTTGIFPFTGSSNFISGLILLIIAVLKLPPLPVWWIPLLLVNGIFSMVIIVALSYLFSSLAFYAPVQCEEISTTVLAGLENTSSFPLEGMPTYVKYPLLTLLPSGLIAWLPSMIILGHRPALATLFPLCIALLFALSAIYFFKKGFRYYVQTGINRYNNGGHRS